MLKAGARFKSAVCDTQILVLRVPSTPVDLSCGGHPMLELTDTPPAGLTLDPDQAAGTLMGKRYVDAAGEMEFLCTKAGAGNLTVNGIALEVKQAKALPSSD